MIKKNILNSQRIFYLMIGLVILSVGLSIMSVIVCTNFLQQKSNQLVDLKLQYRVPEENQASLKQAKMDIEKYTELGKTAKAIVPQEKDQARTVREIINYANLSSVHILSITFPGSNLGQAAVVVPKTPATSGNESSTTAPKVVAPPITQVQAVDGIPGVYLLPITIESDPANPVTFSQIVTFLGKLEQNRRTAQVGQLTITPQKTSTTTGLSFTLTINVYIKP
jgi:hypothetical protein